MEGSRKKVLCFWFIDRFKAQSLFLHCFVKLRDAPVRELYRVLKDRLLMEIQKTKNYCGAYRVDVCLMFGLCSTCLLQGLTYNPFNKLRNGLHLLLSFSRSFTVSERSESLQVLWLRQSESDLSTPLIEKATGKVMTSNSALFLSSLEISAFPCTKNNSESLQVPSLSFDSLYLHCQYSLNNMYS